MPTPSKVLVEQDGAVIVVTINRPEVRNCVDTETAEAGDAGPDEGDNVDQDDLGGED